MGRRQWSSPAVRREVSVLFGTNDAARDKLLDGSRARAFTAAREALGDSEAAERLYYGTKSYCYCKERGITSIPDDDTIPGEDEQLMYPAAPGSPVTIPLSSRSHSPLTIRPRSPGGGSRGRFQSLREVLRRSRRFRYGLAVVIGGRTLAGRGGGGGVVCGGIDMSYGFDSFMQF